MIGTTANGVNEFLGIPFAAPPVGELRWRPPQDVTHWTTTLVATKFGKTCAQPKRGIFTVPVWTDEAGDGRLEWHAPTQ